VLSPAPVSSYFQPNYNLGRDRRESGDALARAPRAAGRNTGVFLQLALIEIKLAVSLADRRSRGVHHRKRDVKSCFLEGGGGVIGRG